MYETLYEETVKVLKENGKEPSDVKFVCAFPFITDWEHFRINSNFHYDSGYGSTEINMQLKIVGDNWYLRRQDYDGSEWWEFEQMPTSNYFQIAEPHEVMQMITGGEHRA